MPETMDLGCESLIKYLILNYSLDEDIYRNNGANKI